uniref:Secreted protein n=1 Tax=Ascaris lumbricoides TaxID=6252 RepID=A0A0M3IXK3_ASCLU
MIASLFMWLPVSFWWQSKRIVVIVRFINNQLAGISFSVRSYRNEIRMDDCAPRQRSTPPAYRDEPPVYSIINSRPSDYSSRTDFHEEKSQQVKSAPNFHYALL